MSMGAGKIHIFRTGTLPLRIPGIAGSFLLLFVESLADLGNPLFISGNVTVLSAQIFLAVAGEYDYQKASALAVVLLIPPSSFFSSRGTTFRGGPTSPCGKAHGGPHRGEGRLDQVALQSSSPTPSRPYHSPVHRDHLRFLQHRLGHRLFSHLEWWRQMFARASNRSSIRLPQYPRHGRIRAVLLGMIVAFPRGPKKFSGKEALDFTSNLGGAVPGTILGIVFVLSFSTTPWVLVVILYNGADAVFRRHGLLRRRRGSSRPPAGTRWEPALRYSEGFLGRLTCSTSSALCLMSSLRARA